MTRSSNLLEVENTLSAKSASYRLPVFAILVLLAAVLIGCGGSDRSEQESQQSTAGSIPSAEVPVPEGVSNPDTDETGVFRGFDQLPKDRMFPGEELNSDGEVDPSTASDRAGMTGIDPLSGKQTEGKSTSAEPAPNRTRFASGALSVSGSKLNTVVDNEGLEVKSDPAQDVETGYAAYRLNSTAGDPALITTDINLPDDTEYYLALADYGASRWRWKGPFTDGRLRLSPENSGDLVSDQGNTFVAVVTSSPDGIVVTGMGAQLADSSDSTAPSAPVNLTATPASGGVLLEWDGAGNPSDLAGYRIYSSSTSFSQKSRAFSNSGELISGRSDHFFETDTDNRLHFRVTAVDTSGNESPLSDGGTATPGSPAPQSSGELKVDRVAGPVGSTVELDASSIQADSYDWDTDGDGQFEESGVSSATKSGVRLTDNAGQPASGLLRPAVRAKNSEGEVTLFASASVLFPQNVRPEIETVRFISDGSPISSGTAPVEARVEAHFSDPDGVVTEVEIDADNNRSFTDSNDDQFNSSSGLTSPQTSSSTITFNSTQQVNVKVSDGQGATGWGQALMHVETDSDVEFNQPPRIDQFDLQPEEGFMGITRFEVTVDATDPDGDDAELEYSYAASGNGDFRPFVEPSSQLFRVSSERSGRMPIGVRVRDTHGALAQMTKPFVARKFTKTQGPRSTMFDADADEIDADHAAAFSVNYSGSLYAGSPNKPALIYSRLDASSSSNRCAISVSDTSDGSGPWNHNYIADYPCEGVAVPDRYTRAFFSLRSPSIVGFRTDTNPAELWVGISDELGGLGNWTTSSVKELTSESAHTDPNSIDMLISASYPDSRFMIAYVDDNDLWIAITNSDAGLQPTGPDSWITYELAPSSVAEGFGPVGDISLTMVDNCAENSKPAIAFYEEDDQHINWITASIATPESASDWEEAFNLDSASRTGVSLSASTNHKCLFENSVTPMVAYHEDVNQSLKLATSDTHTGANKSDWSTETIDAGKGEVSPAGRSSSSHGTLHIGSDPVLFQADTSSSRLVDEPPRPTVFYRNESYEVIEMLQHPERDAAPKSDWESGTIITYGGTGEEFQAGLLGGFPAVFNPEVDPISGSSHFSFVRPVK